MTSGSEAAKTSSVTPLPNTKMANSGRDQQSKAKPMRTTEDEPAQSSRSEGNKGHGIFSFSAFNIFSNHSGEKHAQQGLVNTQGDLGERLHVFSKKVYNIRRLSLTYLMVLLAMTGVVTGLVMYELVDGILFQLSPMIYPLRIFITVGNACTFIYIAFVQLIAALPFYGISVASFINDLLGGQPRNTIFCSYAWADWNQLKLTGLQHFPRRVGQLVRCRWTDIERLFPGENLQSTCARAAKECTLKLLFWSPSYEQRPNCRLEWDIIKQEPTKAIVIHRENEQPSKEFLDTLPGCQIAVIPTGVEDGAEDYVASWFLHVLLNGGQLARLIRNHAPPLWSPNWSTYCDLMGLFEESSASGSQALAWRSAADMWFKVIRKVPPPTVNDWWRVLFKPKAWRFQNSDDSGGKSVRFGKAGGLPVPGDSPLRNVIIRTNSILTICNFAAGMLHALWPDPLPGIIFTAAIFFFLSVITGSAVLTAALWPIPRGPEINPALGLAALMTALDRTPRTSTGFRFNGPAPKEGVQKLLPRIELVFGASKDLTPDLPDACRLLGQSVSIVGLDEMLKRLLDQQAFNERNPELVGHDGSVMVLPAVVQEQQAESMTSRANASSETSESGQQLVSSAGLPGNGSVQTEGLSASNNSKLDERRASLLQGPVSESKCRYRLFMIDVGQFADQDSVIKCAKLIAQDNILQTQVVLWCNGSFGDLDSSVQTAVAKLLVNTGGAPQLTMMMIPWMRMALYDDLTGRIPSEVAGRGLFDLGFVHQRLRVIERAANSGGAFRVILAFLAAIDLPLRFLFGYTVTDFLPRAWMSVGFRQA